MIITNRAFSLLLALLAVVHVVGFSLNVMEVDSAQLAEISREMLLSGNPFKLTYLNEPYLDKPHLLFWAGALSMKLFGISGLAYKLPSLFFAALCVFSCYRFAKLFYNEDTARLAAFIGASYQAMFIATNDVRSDTILMGAVMFAVWQIAALYQSGRLVYLLGSGAGIAFAMMAKGPIGFMVPAFAFIPALIVQGEWRKLINYKWLMVFIIAGILLIPICLAHYVQFGREGLRFYFWTQSFGRITGESSWRNNPDPFFVVHTTLWAFLPYSLFLIYGIVQIIISVFKRRVVPELFSFFGVVVTLFALSRSNYQLPHYFYVAYPLAAIVAADAFYKLLSNHKKWWQYIQYALVIAGLLLPVVIVGFVFPESMPVKTLFIVMAIVLAAFYLYQKNIVVAIVVTFAFVNICLSTVFYPNLLTYQSNTVIGKYLKVNNIRATNFTVLNTWRTYALAFEAQQVPVSVEGIDALKTRVLNLPHYVVCKQDEVPMLAEHYHTEVLLTTEDFPISQLTTKFLNPATRAESTVKRCVVKLN